MLYKSLIILSFLFSAPLAFGQRYTLSGYVKDAQSGEELLGAVIYIRELSQGTSTNTYGYYAINLPAGRYQAVISFLGYQSSTLVLDLQANKVMNIELQRSSLQLAEVVVSAEEARAHIERAELSSIALNMESIRNIPSFFGETDVLRSIQLLPGVQSAGDGNTGFFVRGGDADQNLILLDEAVVYNAAHLFNFFSVFNPDAVKDLKLYKGGIPSRFGGRLSSVLDIRSREGNMKQYRLNGGIGLISSRLSLEGPLQQGKSAFLMAGRRTYADMFLLLSSDQTQRDTRLYFYDLNTKLNYVFNERNRLFLSSYYGRDVTLFGDLFSFDWGNATTSLRWNHLFSPRTFSNFSLIYSNYQFNIRGDVGPARFEWRSYIHNFNLKADFTWFASPDHTLTYGLQSIYHQLDPGLIEASIEDAAATSIRLSANNGLEHGVYVQNDQLLFNNQLALQYGLRYSLFQVMGPGRQYRYQQATNGSREVTDTITLKPGSFYQYFQGWEPRFSFRINTGAHSSFKGSFSRMTQYIQQAQSAQSIAPYDIWFGVSNNIPPQTSTQYALGYFRNFLNNTLESSLEVYYKDMKNITDVIDNGDILGNELVEGELRTGKGWAYGLEFFLKKEHGRFNGFAGYTYAWTWRQIDEINAGEAYFSPYDRRHDLSLSGTYNFSPKYIAGLNFIYASGQAYTLPIGKFSYQGAIIPIYSQRNSGRLPAYHRLDLSLTYKPRQASHKRFSSSWNFSLFNVYGRINPISVSFSESEEKPGIPRSSFFYIPGPIPAITWNFNF